MENVLDDAGAESKESRKVKSKQSAGVLKGQPGCAWVWRVSE